MKRVLLALLPAVVMAVNNFKYVAFRGFAG